MKEDIEVIDLYEIDGVYVVKKGISQSIINKIKEKARNIENILYTLPSFLEVVKASVPSDVYQALLSKDEKVSLALGSLKLMTKKDGTLIANLVNPKTNKIVSQVGLEKIKVTPELSNALTSFATQMQLAHIAESIEYIQLAVEEVRKGQENDRLALAYSCKQKLLQTLAIKDENIRKLSLMNLVAASEDARNTLMLSQGENIKFIKEQPQDTLGRFFKGKKSENIDSRMTELRESFNSVNMLSLIETLAYQELGEEESAKLCMQYYGDYLKNTYLKFPNLIKRLDSIDPSPKTYWSKQLPDIYKNISKMLGNEDNHNKLLEAKDEK